MIISFYAIFLPAAAFSHSQFSHLCARNNTELFGKLPLKKKKCCGATGQCCVANPCFPAPWDRNVGVLLLDFPKTGPT